MNRAGVWLGASLAGGAIALSGCSSEAPAPAPAITQEMPQDTLPSVLADASHESPSDYSYLHTSQITSATYYGEGYTGTANSRYKTIDGLSGSQNVTPSYQILEVTLGHDKQLHYSAPAELPQDEKATLLGTVATNDSFIRSAMTPKASGKAEVDKLRFRIYAPDTSSSYSNHSEMEYVSNDPNNEGKGTVYYTLPAFNAVDTQSIVSMERHEDLHALLGHENDNWLSPENAQRMNAACTVLQKSVVADVWPQGTAQTDLHFMAKNASPQFRPAYQKVIDTLNNGTFTELPVISGTPQTPQCTIQNPYRASARVAESMGQNTEKMTQEAVMDENSPLAKHWESIGDGWEDRVSYDSDLKYISESNYLAQSADNKLAGHPADNGMETAVSTLNCALIDTDEFISNLGRLSADERHAVKTIVSIAAGVLKDRHPDLYDMRIKPVAERIAAIQ